MYSLELKKIIIYFKDKDKKALRRSLFYNQIIKETNFLPEKSNIRRRFWHILNNTKYIPNCLECNNKVNWNNNILEYRIYCSLKCSTNSINIKNKITHTNLKSYGVVHPSQLKSFQDQKKQTCLKQYGVENPAQCSNIKDKIKRTCLKKYSVNHPSKSKFIQNKKKIKCQEKYGLENYNQKHLSNYILNKLKDKEWLKNQHHNKKKTLKEISHFLNISLSYLSSIFKKHKIKVLYFFISNAELSLISYIKTIYFKKIITNSRSIISPYELDIYLPEENLAIEFNGIYWHSLKDKLYHFNKSKLCNDKNIKLIHIFEDDWNNNKNNIKYWLKKYINKDKDFITKELLIKDLDNNLKLSLNWPINYEKLESLGYSLIERINPEKEVLCLDLNHKYSIYNCGKVRYSS